MTAQYDENMPKLSEEQEVILYQLALMQDEQERRSNFKWVKDLEGDPFYKEMIDAEYLTYEKSGIGDKAIGRLIVTLKGERYCTNDIDRIAALHKARSKYLAVEKHPEKQSGK